MTETASIPTHAVDAARQALDQAQVRYENIFMRAPELVIVLPGCGEQRREAEEVGRRIEPLHAVRVVIMAEQGAPKAMLAVVTWILLLLIALATFALVAPYVVGGGPKPESGPGQEQTPQGWRPAQER